MLTTTGSIYPIWLHNTYLYHTPVYIGAYYSIDTSAATASILLSFPKRLRFALRHLSRGLNRNKKLNRSLRANVYRITETIIYYETIVTPAAHTNNTYHIV